MNRSTEIRLDELKTKKIQLGFVGENLYRQVWFMCDEIYAQFPHAAAALTVMPPKGQSYPAVLERVDNAVVWNITDSDLAYRGSGEIQLSFVVDEMVAKTYVGRFEIERSLSPQGEAPTGIDDFLTRAGAALTAIPETIDAALEEAKESGEFDGPPGPPGEDGKDGRNGVDGKDGKDGQDGAPGQDGKDGKDGQDGRDGTNGTNGTDGADAYVWIRYAAVQPTADADMKTTPDAWIGIYSGDAATAPEHYTDYAWYKIKGEPGAVQDVQINGTSVLQNGIAKIPKASNNNVGALKTNAWYGTDMDNETLYINGASASDEKAGTQEYKPITPSSQHTSAFYALAKLAGADMKNSSNPVGQYTDDAKAAIQKMLGIYEAPWEVIVDDEVTYETDSAHLITVDSYGEPFELTDLVFQIWFPVQNNEAGMVSNYGMIDFYYSENEKLTAECGRFTQEANAFSRGAMAKIETEKGMNIFGFTRNQQTGNMQPFGYYFKSSAKYDKAFMLPPETFTKIEIRSIKGTAHYKLIGKRKWN